MRTTLALACLLSALALSRPALADVTVTGTVGEIGATTAPNNANAIHFNFTDANQTATCLEQKGGFNWPLGVAKLAYFLQGDVWYREWYAMLLVSKKGATLTCTVASNQDCHVTSCILP